MDNPIVFLDFDGVLNSEFWIWTHADSDFGAHIDPEKVLLVNRLLELTGAKVVVSSAWRKLYTDDQLREGLKGQGFTGEIVGSTDHRGPLRGDEIQRWLTKHDHTGAFVIIDDSVDMCHLLPFLVRTDAEYGFMPRDLDKAVAVLEGGENRG